MIDVRDGSGGQRSSEAIERLFTPVREFEFKPQKSNFTVQEAAAARALELDLNGRPDVSAVTAPFFEFG
jgi:hypothetical protein